MKTTSVVVGSATFSQWIPVDSYINPISISLGCTISSGATLTYQVQHTFDSPWNMRQCVLSRSSTTATVTLADHGLVVGDSVLVEQAGAPFDGTFAVASVVDANSFTYTVLNSGSTGTYEGKIAPMRVFPHSSVTAKTTNSDGNYAYPVAAVRLNVTAYTSGKVTLNVTQGS